MTLPTDVWTVGCLFSILDGFNITHINGNTRVFAFWHTVDFIGGQVVMCWSPVLPALCWSDWNIFHHLKNITGPIKAASDLACFFKSDSSSSSGKPISANSFSKSPTMDWHVGIDVPMSSTTQANDSQVRLKGTLLPRSLLQNSLTLGNGPRLAGCHQRSNVKEKSSTWTFNMPLTEFFMSQGCSSQKSASFNHVIQGLSYAQISHDFKPRNNAPLQMVVAWTDIVFSLSLRSCFLRASPTRTWKRTQT